MIALVLTLALGSVDDTVTVGSKKFTESVVLGEMVTLLGRDAGALVRHQRELGGTRILFNALVSGELDAYPEYTGTLRHEILAGVDLSAPEALRRELAARGVFMTAPLGFNNTYALGLRRGRAEELGLRTISDLAGHPELSFGFSNEFMERGDGWPGLRERYGLPQQDVRGLDHDLAYRGLESGHLDVIDLYATDAEVRYYDLAVLEDDRDYFPRYDAVILLREDLRQRAPEVVAAVRRLAGSLDASRMAGLNAAVKIDRRGEAEVAAGFLEQEFGVVVEVAAADRWRDLVRHTGEHLALVAVSLLAALLVAVPLGIRAARRPVLGQVVLAVAGLCQTIPSLALFVFMIPLFGIGSVPAAVALFLYSLLPILRNTHAGLRGIPLPILESAQALGLGDAARLWRIELPLALPSILAGVKTSAVINVGTATLGALIGAGGYGQPILTGIRRDDVGLILFGAVPAAVLALLVQALFELAERAVVPRGLRPRPAARGASPS